MNLGRPRGVEPQTEHLVEPKLTFGYLYDFRNPAPWRRPWAGLYAAILDFAAYTETLGFHGAWVPEHHAADDGYMPSPLVALAAIAARTKRMKLGSGIALAPLYHPVRFAEECAVLDHLSGGRLEMAVAIGYPDIVAVTNTILNQTGQAIEGIMIIMAAYLVVSLSISIFMNWYTKRIALVER